MRSRHSPGTASGRGSSCSGGRCQASTPCAIQSLDGQSRVRKMLLLRTAWAGMDPAGIWPQKQLVSFRSGVIAAPTVACPCFRCASCSRHSQSGHLSSSHIACQYCKYLWTCVRQHIFRKPAEPCLVALALSKVFVPDACPKKFAIPSRQDICSGATCWSHLKAQRWLPHEHNALITGMLHAAARE